MSEKSEQKEKRRYPLVEWISAGIGFLITAILFGFLAYEASIESASTPPILVIAPVGLKSTDGQYIVEVEVENRSSSTAAAVAVQGVLHDGRQSLTTSSATFDYVPGNSFRRGGLIFATDPRRHRIELRVTGYQRP